MLQAIHFVIVMVELLQFLLLALLVVLLLVVVAAWVAICWINSIVSILSSFSFRHVLVQKEKPTVVCYHDYENDCLCLCCYCLIWAVVVATVHAFPFFGIVVPGWPTKSVTSFRDSLLLL